MDFLAKHYEKLILAICLVCLIAYVGRIDSQENYERNSTAQVKRKMGSIIKADKLVEVKEASELPTLKDMLSLPEAKINFTNSPNGDNKSGLLENGAYIVCKSKDCGYVIFYKGDVQDGYKCPKCGTVQDAPAPEVLPTDDLDKDGIPDLVEKSPEMEGLNYRYPYDATEDFDGDGFTNYEEYLAGTDINDPESHPALAALLRVKGKVYNSNLPYTLSRVSDAGGSPTKADWKVSFKLGKVTRAETIQMGESLKRLDGYVLSGIADSRDSVTFTNSKNETYVMELGKPVREKGASIPFIYLTSHDRYAPQHRRSMSDMKKPQPKADNEADANAGMMGGPQGSRGKRRFGNAGGMGMADIGMTGGATSSTANPLILFTAHEGDTFLLELTPSGQVSSRGNMGMGGTSSEAELEPIAEWYVVLPCQGDQVMVQQLSGEDGEPIGEPIAIRPLDEPDPKDPKAISKDFQRAAEKTNDSMMGGPGGMMSPRRPQRR